MENFNITLELIKKKKKEGKKGQQGRKKPRGGLLCAEAEPSL